MRNKHIKAFTLVELLVVISIIALLLSVLMPSLSRAREQARTLLCGNNFRQIGIATSAYQAENQQRVPVVFSRYQYGSVPMRNRLLSLALYGYLEKKPALPVNLNPAQDWYVLDYQKRMQLFSDKYMSNYFKCPFGKGTAVPVVSSPSGTIQKGGVTFSKYEFKAKSDSYSTYLWEYSAGQNAIMSDVGIAIPGYGRSFYPKFATFAWHSMFTLYPQEAAAGEHPMSAKMAPRLIASPPKWDNPKRLGASLSTVSVGRCEVGEFLNLGIPYIFNYGSHRKGSGGGTNVLLGDGHVEWVDSQHVFN